MSRHYNLGFISDADIRRHVRDTVMEAFATDKNLHRKIIGHINGGWEVLPTESTTDYDIRNLFLHTYAVLRRDAASVSEKEQTSLYLKMQRQVLDDARSLCLLVELTSDKGEDKPWVMDADGVECSHPQIRKVSLDKFYALVTGDERAYKRLSALLSVMV